MKYSEMNKEFHLRNEKIRYLEAEIDTVKRFANSNKDKENKK